MSILITGASGGIGSAICDRLTRRESPLRDYGLTELDVDVTDAAKLEFFFQRRAFTTLIYAAGKNWLDWSATLDPTEMLDLFDVNVVGLLRCLQLQPSIKRAVVIGSDAAHRPMRTSAAYNASKAALEAMVKCIARERAAEGFVINLVSPGLIADTAMTDYVIGRTGELRPDLDVQAYMLDGIPMRRAGFAEEIAEVVAFLIDRAPNYLNGSVITVNGAR